MTKLEILPDHWMVRCGSWDWNVFDSVVIRNEYRLPPTLRESDVVVDVGAHIGSFSWACLERGAGRVIAIEASEPNYVLCGKNLAPYEERVRVHHGAAWYRLEQLYFTPCVGPNTGGGGVVGSTPEQVPTPTILLDELIKGFDVSILKMDCEGSEWPILSMMSDYALAGVAQICGEWHDQWWAGKFWCVHDLIRILTAHGFKGHYEATSSVFGLFWAVR